jgi:hypothetical protein
MIISGLFSLGYYSATGYQVPYSLDDIINFLGMCFLKPQILPNAYFSCRFIILQNIFNEY